MNTTDLEKALVNTNSRINHYLGTFIDVRSAHRMDAHAGAVASLVKVKKHLETELGMHKLCECAKPAAKKAAAKDKGE